MPPLFYELFSGLPRQGPGEAGSTRKALAMVPGVGPQTRILDIGCGTGLPTCLLAKETPASIVAIDEYPPFIEELKHRAQAQGSSGRIDARVGDMRHLDFPDASFDLLWSEGSIFIIGFEEGLRRWRRLLKPGGHLALTESCWMKPNPPAECEQFWKHAYPAIRDVPSMLAAIGACGYETVGHFPLPPSSWWDDYYRPLQGHIVSFRERHRSEPEALALADEIQHEIDVWRAYSAFYSYEFFILRVPNVLIGAVDER